VWHFTPQCTDRETPLGGDRGQRADRAGLTGDGEHVGLDLCGDLDATPPLRVVRAAQARHVGYTAFMDVHQTVCKNHTHKHTL